MYKEYYYKVRPNFIYYLNLFFLNTPIFFLISNVISWFSILKNYNSFKLVIHFNYCFTLIAPFYWVRYLNLKKYGTRGITPTLGLGNHKLFNYWIYNTLSQFLFYKSGIWFYMLSSFVLTSALIVILLFCNFEIIIFTFFILIFCGSKIFHKFTFVCQNYNALGWSFCPFFFYFMGTQEYFFASIFLLIISFLSLTATILISTFSLCFCLDSQSFLPLMTLFPSIIKIFICLIHGSGVKNILNTLSFISKSIGFTKRNTKYILKRDKFKRKYILYFYVLFQIYNFYQSESLNLFFLLFSILVITNYFIARFCDEQSLDILSFIVLFHFVSNQPQLDLFNIFFIVLLLNFSFMQIYDHSLIKRPLSCEPFINAFEDFFKPIKDNSKVFFCFSDPKNKYEDLFDRQRYLLDFPSYCAVLRNIHLFPDYSTVFDTNYPDSPQIWANSPSETQILLKEYDTQYCIVSQNTESDLSKKWLEAGYSIVTTFDWGLFLNKNKIDRNLWWFGMPKWFLLKSF